MRCAPPSASEDCWAFRLWATLASVVRGWYNRGGPGGRDGGAEALQQLTA